jgi:hypothetical protein
MAITEALQPPAKMTCLGPEGTDSLRFGRTVMWVHFLAVARTTESAHEAMQLYVATTRGPTASRKAHLGPPDQPGA